MNFHIRKVCGSCCF